LANLRKSSILTQFSSALDPVTARLSIYLVEDRKEGIHGIIPLIAPIIETIIFKTGDQTWHAYQT